MMDKFDPTRHDRIKGQQGPILDKEKASQMAKVEDHFQEKALKHADNPVYAEKGITPEYIRSIGELEAESVGATYDFKQTAREMTTKDLKQLRKDLQQELKLFTNTHLSPPTGMGEQRSPEEANERARYLRILTKIHATENELKTRSEAGSQGYLDRIKRSLTGE